jgi:hypothetical protein
MIERYDYVKVRYPGMVENEIGFIRDVVMLYRLDNDEVIKYLDDEGAAEKAREMFSSKMFRYKMKKRERTKMALFMISPKAYRKMIHTYLKLKKRF